MKVHLVIIDPQNDFMDTPNAALPVKGAVADMKRLAKLIDRIGHRLDNIHVTLDSHHLIDIAHPTWWRDENGQRPEPFTIITAQDIADKIWVPRVPAFYQRSLAYAQQLEQEGKYQLCIWPPHCLIARTGHNVQADLDQALQRWSDKTIGIINYVTKGSNPFTEHYGALMAEVPDPEDPTTTLNTDFLDILQEADIIGLAGEALSHCVKETITQIADNIDEKYLRKFYILTDCSSPVPAVPDGPDFPQIAADWLEEMKDRGMNLVKAEEFLA
jgi:nicotinamidase-related amidase